MGDFLLTSVDSIIVYVTILWPPTIDAEIYCRLRTTCQ